MLIHDTPPSVALLTAGGMSGFAGPKLVALGQTPTWLVERERHERVCVAARERG